MKTRVFFSRNVNHNRRTELSNILGFQMAADLGKYLGVPLHHKRVTKESFSDVVDKVKKRLSSWKANSLSLAGRATLVGSVTSAILSYTMQTASIPIGSCDMIDRNNRSFLWGTTQEKRKNHLVSWDTVCKSKVNGGLGLRHIKTQNQAFMAKLGWNLIKNKDDLWVRIIRSKYQCGNDLIPQIDLQRRGSNTWGGIKAAWKFVQEGTEVENGRQNVRWKHTRNGDFSVKSAYQVIANEPVNQEVLWQKIWKLNSIPRCKTFMWLVAHNKLLTNVERYRRGMCVDDICGWCHKAPETMLHVLRDCTETKRLWMEMITLPRDRRFFDINLKEWLNFNIRRLEWSDWFATLCWLLWKRRNERLFEHKNESNEGLRNHAHAIISSTKKASKRLVGVNLQGNFVTDREATWTPPDDGWIKVNVDGAFARYTGAGCGGIIREADGNFIMAFMHRLEFGDHITAELWGILLGLKTTWDQGKRRVVLETDAKEVLNLINSGDCQNHPDATTIEEIRLMMQREWRIELQFVPRNANRVADFLAKKALSVVTGFHPILYSFPELAAVLELDQDTPTDVG